MADDKDNIEKKLLRNFVEQFWMGLTLVCFVIGVGFIIQGAIELTDLKGMDEAIGGIKMIIGLLILIWIRIGRRT